MTTLLVVVGALLLAVVGSAVLDTRSPRDAQETEDLIVGKGYLA
jgi:hypothetical protein